jgi:hypothetical protein
MPLVMLAYDAKITVGEAQPVIYTALRRNQIEAGKWICTRGLPKCAMGNSLTLNGKCRVHTRLAASLPVRNPG